ncbi:MAG: Crp/Fnr family transcriptional regulator [Cyclobacteriaceae bacterium]|nr:Crp/Fnr family transcriptional regulator [Cyclobacteriaceae bacterium HetDA_MAG_MS6]
MFRNQKQYLDLLRASIYRFEPVSDESFEALANSFKLRAIKKGEYLISKGQVSKKMYFVCSGILVSQWLDGLGNVHIKNFFLEGDFAASTVSSLKVAPSEFSLQALKPTDLLEIDYGVYKQLIYQYDDLKIFYIHYLEQKWVIENEKRQISFAAQDASERYKSFLKDYPKLDQRIALRYIASFLGITPTQLSRVRKSF